MKKNNYLKITDFLEKMLLDLAEIEDPLKTKSKKTKKAAEEVVALSDEYVFSSSKNKAGESMISRLVKTYALYFMPANMIKLHPVLDEIRRDKSNRLFEKNSLSVLDFGCGPGTFTLSVLEYAVKLLLQNSHMPESVSLTLVDRSKENLSFSQEIIKKYLGQGLLPENIRWETRFRKGSFTFSEALRKMFCEEDRFDLIIAGNVITELQEQDITPFIEFLEKHLSPEGTAVIIDPGTKASFRHLLALRDLIIKNTGLTLYAPCPNTGTCPLTENNKNWCHEKVFWDPPAIIKTIDRITGFSKEKGLKFSYLTFKRKGSALSGFFPGIPPEKVYRVVSYLIKNKGEERVYVCNGRERLFLRRLNKNSSGTNRGFENVLRGSCVYFENPDHRKNFLDITKESIFKIL